VPPPHGLAMVRWTEVFKLFSPIALMASFVRRISDMGSARVQGHKMRRGVSVAPPCPLAPPLSAGRPANDPDQR